MENQSKVSGERPVLVSVIIPTYNRRNYIRESLDSVLAQDFYDFEVIVVDDGSTDGTEEEVRPYQDRICYTRQENKGAGAARNVGIRKARGQYIAFMDSDDLSRPHHLKCLSSFLDRNPECAMVVGNGGYLEGNYRNRSTIISAKRVKRLEQRGITVKELFDGRVVRLQGTMTRKTVFEEIGLLDEWFRLSYDLDLALRIIKDHQIGFINEEVYLWRQHGDNISSNDELRSRENLRALEKLAADFPEGVEQIGKRAFDSLCAHRYYRLAKALARKGDVKGAREAIGEAVALRPLLPKYRFYWFRWRLD
jgi:glycosyltransferase involved in cell wall biosynthesis